MTNDEIEFCKQAINFWKKIYFNHGNTVSFFQFTNNEVLEFEQYHQIKSRIYPPNEETNFNFAGMKRKGYIEDSDVFHEHIHTRYRAVNFTQKFLDEVVNNG